MSAQSVRTSVLHGAQDLRLVHHPLTLVKEHRNLPPPSSDEVQIAVRSTGLCGSDLHYFNHYRNGDIIVKEPLTLGHESSGTVVAVGINVRELAVGDSVALEVGQPCETCTFCTQGRYNICTAMKFRSSAKAVPHAQGTLQELINHPAKWCHKLPHSISLELGALMEPLGVALHAHARAGPLSSKSSVLVLGAGAVGLLVAAVAKANGAGEVIIADVQPRRTEFAVLHHFADKGIIVPMERPESTADKLKYAQRVAAHIGTASQLEKGGGQMDVVFECTGVESCVQTAIYATKAGGKVMLIGMGTPIMTLPISAAALREVDLVGVFRYANTYPRAISLLSDPPPDLPDLTMLITHRFHGMDEISGAFDYAGQPIDQEGCLVIKVMVNLGSTEVQVGK